MARGNRKITLPHPTQKEVNMENRPTEAELQTAFDEADKANPPSDPPLPAGVTAKSNGSNGSEAETETLPDEADLPIGRRSNKVAIERGKLYDRARDLGDSKIRGERSLLGLAELALEGGDSGLLDVDRGEVEELYKRFRDPNVNLKKARYETGETNQDSFKSNVAKLEWFTLLGRDFHNDGVNLFNRAHDVYKGMIGDAQKRKSLKLAASYEAVLAVVRGFMMEVAKQAKQQVTLTAADMPDNAAIEKSLWKKPTTPDDAIDALADAFNRIDKANEGVAATKKAPERLGLKDSRLNDALEILRDVAKEQGDEDYERFTKATAPKPVAAPKAKKGKGKKAAPATNGATDEANEGEDAPVGSEGPSADAVV